ncbi:hypothetical protein HMPREF9065_00573 [Aggregatibacter sp. oral taxon 458 str. W10330]|nr:hypothetical protein HMPREF9065_00573 [Aggregatibacter sp. oral taxon 458 str. W10330]
MHLDARNKTPANLNAYAKTRPKTTALFKGMICLFVQQVVCDVGFAY